MNLRIAFNRCISSRFTNLMVTRNIISGHATSKGTLSFVKNAQLPLYHKFDKVELYANPIIHGPPNVHYMLNEHSVNNEVVMHNEETNSLVQKAIFRNKSNCIYVYSYNNSNYNSLHKGSNKDHGIPYVVTNLKEYMISTTNNSTTSTTTTSSNTVHRSNVITIADIGSTLDPIEIRRRIAEARVTSQLDVIDCIVWRCTEDGFYDIDQYDKCMYMYMCVY